MALQTSAAISFANLQSEFGGSHPITMGEYASHRVSGSGNTISMNQFYGASSNETQTVTVGSYYDGAAYISTTSYGYSSDSNSYGSISDGTLGVAGNKTIQLLAWNNINIVTLRVAGVASNSGWTTMTVNGTAFSRASASFYSNGTASTAWQWLTITTNPFGTSGTKQVVFT